MEPVFAKHPEMVEVMERLVEPERMIAFRVAWVDDSGKQQVCDQAVGPASSSGYEAIAGCMQHGLWIDDTGKQQLDNQASGPVVWPALRCPWQRTVSIAGRRLRPPALPKRVLRRRRCIIICVGVGSSCMHMHAGEPRLPGAVQQRPRAVQGRPATPPVRDAVHHQVPGLRAGTWPPFRPPGHSVSLGSFLTVSLQEMSNSMPKSHCASPDAS